MFKIGDWLKPPYICPWLVIRPLRKNKLKINQSHSDNTISKALIIHVIWSNDIKFHQKREFFTSVCKKQNLLKNDRWIRKFCGYHLDFSQKALFFFLQFFVSNVNSKYELLWFINQIWKAEAIITKQSIQPEIYTANMSSACLWFIFFLFHSFNAQYLLVSFWMCCKNADCSNVCLNFHKNCNEERKKQTNERTNENKNVDFICVLLMHIFIILWCNLFGENETRPRKI